MGGCTPPPAQAQGAGLRAPRLEGRLGVWRTSEKREPTCPGPPRWAEGRQSPRLGTLPPPTWRGDPRATLGAGVGGLGVGSGRGAGREGRSIVCRPRGAQGAGGGRGGVGVTPAFREGGEVGAKEGATPLVGSGPLRPRGQRLIPLQLPAGTQAPWPWNRPGPVTASHGRRPGKLWARGAPVCHNVVPRAGFSRAPRTLAPTRQGPARRQGPQASAGPTSLSGEVTPERTRGRPAGLPLPSFLWLQGAFRASCGCLANVHGHCSLPPQAQQRGALRPEVTRGPEGALRLCWSDGGGGQPRTQVRSGTGVGGTGADPTTTV